jgi:tRNA (guanosine-2'-O-)-methyltransferase
MKENRATNSQPTLPTKQDMAVAIQNWYKAISAHKKERIKQVLAGRTRHITIALEDTFQPFNASAILRTAEIFGIQDIHVVECRNSFRPSVGISRGAVKWLDIHRYTNAATAIKRLKDEGFCIAATSLTSESLPIDQLPVHQKTALFFGNELIGLTPTIMAAADIAVHIPMFGFTQSFNVSASVAICLQQLVSTLRASNIAWQLTQEEQLILEYQWCKQLVNRR